MVAFLIDEGSIYPFPCPITTPLPIVVIDALGVGKLTRKVFPLASRFDEVENGIDDLS